MSNYLLNPTIQNLNSPCLGNLVNPIWLLSLTTLDSTFILSPQPTPQEILDIVSLNYLPSPATSHHLDIHSYSPGHFCLSLVNGNHMIHACVKILHSSPLLSKIPRPFDISLLWLRLPLLPSWPSVPVALTILPPPPILKHLPTMYPKSLSHSASVWVPAHHKPGWILLCRSRKYNRKKKHNTLAFWFLSL